MAGQDPLSIVYNDDDGKELTTTSGQIFKQLSDNGYQVKGVSGDGMTFHFADQRGDYDMQAPDVLQNLGYKVSHVKPNNPDESKIDLGYRMAISRLPDDDAKKAYLESKLKRQGVENPNVVGKGRDFYYYDPNSNNWHALTNSQHWDAGDLVEGAVEGGTGLAAGIGGVLGSVGGIPGAMGGAALGSAAAETALRGYLTATDPEYAGVTTLGGQAKDVAMQAGINGLVGGIPGVAGKALKSLGIASEEGVKQAFRGGPVSALAKGMGKSMQAGGGLAQTAGDLMNTPVGKEVVKSFVPGLSQAQMMSTAMQAPEYLTVGAAKAAQKAAGSDLASSVLGSEEAGGLKKAADEIISKQAPDGMFARFNKWARGTTSPDDVSAANVLQNVGEKAAQSMGAEEGTVNAVKNFGAKTGRSFEDLANVGRTIDNASNVVVGAGANTLKGLGVASKVAGKGLQAAGNVAQPFEAQIAGQALGDKYLLPGMRQLMLDQERKALRNKLQQSDTQTTSNP